MGKLILKSFKRIPREAEGPFNYEYFNEKILINIGEEGKNDYNKIFTLDAVSCDWLKVNLNEHNDESMYFQYGVAMKYYNEIVLEYHIKRALKRCNLELPENRFNLLTRYLKYENEESLY